MLLRPHCRLKTGSVARGVAHHISVGPFDARIGPQRLQGAAAIAIVGRDDLHAGDRQVGDQRHVGVRADVGVLSGRQLRGARLTTIWSLTSCADATAGAPSGHGAQHQERQAGGPMKRCDREGLAA